MTVGYYILMFSLGLVLLVWGSGLFVDSAVSLANRFRLPEVLIGATIVSLGTTLPETLFSTMASVKGLPDMALGNALGSILCNTGFIAGTLIFLRPVLLKPREVKDVRTGLCFLGTALGLYASCGYLTGGLPRTAGITLLCLCIAFFLNSIRRAMGYGHHTHRNVGRRERAALLGRLRVVGDVFQESFFEVHDLSSMVIFIHYFALSYTRHIHFRYNF